MKYVLIDGNIVPCTPATTRWLQRADRQVPQVQVADEVIEAELPKDTRTEYQIIEGLGETSD